MAKVVNNTFYGMVSPCFAEDVGNLGSAHALDSLGRNFRIWSVSDSRNRGEKDYEILKKQKGVRNVIFVLLKRIIKDERSGAFSWEVVEEVGESSEEKT